MRIILKEGISFTAISFSLMLKFHAVERLIHPQTEHDFSMVNENLILFV